MLRVMAVLVILGVSRPAAATPDDTSGRGFVVEAEGLWKSRRWVAECRADVACALRIGKRRVGLVPMRGGFECTQDRSQVLCVFTHATHLHMQQLWWIDLRRRTATMQWGPGWPEIIVGTPWRTDDGGWTVWVERDDARTERVLKPPRSAFGRR